MTSKNPKAKESMTRAKITVQNLIISKKSQNLDNLVGLFYTNHNSCMS